MVEIEFRGVHYQRCPNCTSAWLDPGAMRAIWARMEPERPLRFTERPPDAADRLCPDCNRAMMPVFLPYHVPVEWCELHGVWLDPEELGVTLAAAYIDEERWWRDFGALARTFT